MTPLDSLERMLRERLAYHADQLTMPGQDTMFHIGNMHALSVAISMAQRLQRGENRE